MANIVLISDYNAANAGTVNTKAMLEAKGHTVTFFEHDIVATNPEDLSGYDLIYWNAVGDGDFFTWMPALRDYQRVNNIPVVFGARKSSGFGSTPFIELYGLANDCTIFGDPPRVTQEPYEAFLPVGFEDIPVVSGMDRNLRITIRQPGATPGGQQASYIQKDALYVGDVALYIDDPEDCRADILMLVGDGTEISLTDGLAIGAPWCVIWTSGFEGHGKDGAAIIESFIQWALDPTIWVYPTAGDQLALSEPQDLSRLGDYQSSQVQWFENEPASTSADVETSIDTTHLTFSALSAPDDPIATLVDTDDVTNTSVVLKVLLATSDDAATPVAQEFSLFLEGYLPAIRQLGGGPDSDPLVLAEDDWLNGGLLTWTSGANEGISMEVKTWVSSTRVLTLFLPMQFPIAIGDTFDVYPGCGKDRVICKGKFDNLLNFRGEPDVPGQDQLLRYPNSPY